MGFRIGPFDPIQLVFALLNLLMKKNLITIDEVRLLLKESLDPKLPEEEKEKILDSIINNKTENE